MRLPDKLKGCNLYHLLGIKNFSGEEEIKRGYRRLAWEFHPDRFSQAKDAALKFELGSGAYEILKTPATRKKYDYCLRKNINLPWRVAGSDEKVWGRVNFSASFNDPGRPKENPVKQSTATSRDRCTEFWENVSRTSARPKIHSPRTQLDGDFPGFVSRCRKDFREFLNNVPRLQKKPS